MIDRNLKNFHVELFTLSNTVFASTKVSPEVCKWLIKNGPPMNFAERESNQLFLHQERKSKHFETWKDESAKYYEKSWVSFDKYFWLIAIM